MHMYGKYCIYRMVISPISGIYSDLETSTWVNTDYLFMGETDNKTHIIAIVLPNVVNYEFLKMVRDVGQ